MAIVAPNAQNNRRQLGPFRFLNRIPMFHQNRIHSFSHDSFPGVTLKISSSVPLNSSRDMEIIASKIQEGNLIPTGSQGVMRFRVDGDRAENAEVFPL